jgi:hypothetical protein
LDWQVEGDFHLWFRLSLLFVLPIFRTLGWFNLFPIQSLQETHFCFLGVNKFYMSRSCKSFRLNIQHMVWKSRRSTLDTFPYAKLQHQPKAIDNWALTLYSALCVPCAGNSKADHPHIQHISLEAEALWHDMQVWNFWLLGNQEDYKAKDHIE